MADPAPPGRPDYNGPSQGVAKARFYFIAAHRLVGAALVIIGMLAMEGALPWGRGLGKGLAIGGLFIFGVAPLILARAWRTPRG